MHCRLGLSTLASLLLLPAAGAGAQTLVPNDLTLDTSFVSGLRGPVGAEFLPDGRMVIIQQAGGIRVRPAGGGALINAGSIAVDLAGERGLLGVAVDPDFATSNRIYFYWSAQGAPANDRHRVGWATIDPATSMIDTANITTIVRGLFGPANHNGGGIAFGPDRNLYIGVGDTGCNCSCSPGSADNFFPTCLTNGNGKILRVDRDGNIPASNPLVGLAAVPACGANPRPENNRADGCNAPLYMTETGAPREDIYNWGFRNPWRFAFDPVTGFLWIGDVGEVTYEEITISTGPGQHHGWPFREGAHGDPVTSCPTATPQATGDCVDPAYEYRHSGSGSVTGGVFTTHCSWPAPYQGRYWFGDYTTDVRQVWTIEPNATRDGVVANSRSDILRNVEGIVHFANGPDGALYMVNANEGEVWRLAPTAPIVCTPDAGVAPDSGIPPDSGVHPDAAAMTGDAPLGPRDADPIADALAPGMDATATATAPDASVSTAADAGARDGSIVAMPNGEDDGCGCTTAEPTSALAGGAMLLGLALLARRRRR